MVNAAPREKQRYSKPSFSTAIVTDKNSLHQYLLLIKDFQLTELIENLENFGITNDLAIFFIASLQILEVGQ